MNNLIEKPVAARFAVEAMFHKLLREYFLRARQDNIPGEMEITVTMSGNVSSGEAKIETNVQCGDWRNRGSMKARNIDIAYLHATERFRVNEQHNVPLLRIDPTDF